MTVRVQAFGGLMLKPALLLSLLLLAATTCLSTHADLSDWYRGNADNTWRLDPPAIIRTVSPTPLAWLDQEQTKLRYQPGRDAGKNPLAFAGINLCEAIFEFHEKRLSLIVLSLYNRGDVGEIELREFEKMLSDIESHLEQLAGHKADQEQSFIGAVRLFHKNWNDGFSDFNLQWSYSRRRTRVPEYITLTIKPSVVSDNTTVAQRPATTVSTSESRVRTDRHGNRYLEIPMVDQGAKGYCAAAVLERIMRFYGADTDQHVFAQMLETSPEEGTQMDYMLKTLRRAGSKLGIRNRPIYRNDDFSSRANFNRMINKYNRAAKRANADMLRIRDFHVTVKGHAFYDYRAMARAIDPEVYKKMRVEEYAREFKKFQDEVVESIDQGIPVAWGVVLGMVRESGAGTPGQGGHMRIINGHNPVNGKVIYTDSWGAGHEFKEISWEDAWTMTMFAAGIAPAN